MTESAEFELSAYEKLFDSKHHYDNLSWIIGAPVLAVAGGLIAYMPSLHDEDRLSQILERLVVALFIWCILFGWRRIYERNRFFAEVANEAIRDFERKHRTRGAGIAFMHATLTGKVILKNTDENGQVLADPLTERLRVSSIHFAIPRLATLVGLLAGLACLLP